MIQYHGFSPTVKRVGQLRGTKLTKSGNAFVSAHQLVDVSRIGVITEVAQQIG